MKCFSLHLSLDLNNAPLKHRQDTLLTASHKQLSASPCFKVSYWMMARNNLDLLSYNLIKTLHVMVWSTQTAC